MEIQIKKLGGNLMKALITGGTGSVGSELVKKFCESGNYDITFTYHRNKLHADELSKQYRCKAVQIDAIESDYSIVINNVGIVNSLVSCENVDIEAWEETLHTNLTLPFVIIKKVLPHMKRQEWGRIINISSIYGIKAEEDVTPYVVSKHGLMGLTKVVAREYAQFGITCNAICPGTVVSEMSERLADYYTSNEEEKKEYFNELNDAIPAKRLVRPHEIADFALFIASKEASYINGATLMIDGGYTA
jgi:NAD(P)-dependent dehydrogenase (short-subunit alcohol dehydrogenase family)